MALSTSSAPFLSVSQSGTGSSWSNLTNVLVNNTARASGDINTSGVTNTQDMDLNSPSNNNQIPPSAIITGIRVRVRCSIDAPTASEPRLDRVQIENGTNSYQSNEITDTGDGTVKTFAGDLTYWGVDQTQARDFANGSLDFFFEARAFGVTGDAVVRVQYVDVLFEYEFAPQGLVYFPGIF